MGKVLEAMGKFKRDVSDEERILFLTAREKSTKGHFKIRGLRFPSFVADNGYWWQRYV